MKHSRDTGEQHVRHSDINRRGAAHLAVLTCLDLCIPCACPPCGVADLRTWTKTTTMTLGSDRPRVGMLKRALARARLVQELVADSMTTTLMPAMPVRASRRHLWIEVVEPFGCSRLTPPSTPTPPCPPHPPPSLAHASLSRCIHNWDTLWIRSQRVVVDGCGRFAVALHVL